MPNMTPRERVQAALNHQEPDQIPLDIGGTVNSSIVTGGYERLKRHLNIHGETNLLNKLGCVALLDETVMHQLGCDLRPLLIKPPIEWSPPFCEPGYYKDIWGITWK